MADDKNRVEADRKRILDARERGTGAKFWLYTKLSGPGWLQGAITLGGGSLAGSLYVGIIGGYEMLWLQPLMIIFGIVMLSAIGYVALSTGERPFQAINKHVNPVLGWGWAIATLMANLVWAMPQFSLGSAALEQNLFPGLGEMENGSVITAVILFAIAAVVIWFYESGGWGIKLFEIILKVMVGVVVLSFFGVVGALTFSDAGLPWGSILAGFVPNPSTLFEPAGKFSEILGQVSDKAYWSGVVLSTQRDIMITAAATAVGINMTFLMPYALLRRGWDKDFRGLATFDLSIGLFVPFVLATSCVVIAAATQFHGEYEPALVGEAEMTPRVEKLVGAHEKIMEKFAKVRLEEAGVKEPTEEAVQAAITALPAPDKKIAAILIKRDAFQLAGSLENLTGKGVAQYVFGIGVLGMAISTIIILMLINGFTICEMLSVQPKGLVHRAGSLLPGITGALGFLWLWGDADARFWLAVPTSVFGMVLLPIAYLTFFFMMNNKKLLGQHMPQGGRRNLVNTLMVLALLAALTGASYAIWSKAQWYGVGAVGIFVAAAVFAHFSRRPSP